jgi:heptosyltransferase-2
MRILAVSNFYPPYYLTGYELGCRDYVEALRARGHEVRVLTSRYCFREEVVEDGVYRWLKFVLSDRLVWGRALLKELINQNAFTRVSLDFRPDVLLFFNLSHVSASLGLMAQDANLPRVFYVANHWSSSWERDHWAQSWPKRERGGRILRLLARSYRLRPPLPPLNLENAAFTNRYLREIARELGVPMARSEVIPWGIDTDRFSWRPSPNRSPSRLLCVGQVRPQKSLHVAIRALDVLKREYGYDNLTLTIVGYDPTDSRTLRSDYLSHLRDLARRRGLQDRVRFTGWRPRENLPSLYQDHDIFLHLSAEEGTTSLALMEAMSCGLGVLSTMTCGLEDLLENEKNALAFAAENAPDLACQTARLLADRALFEAIRLGGRTTIEAGFRLEKSSDALEALLEKAVAAKPAGKGLETARPAVTGVPRRREGSLTAVAGKAKKWVVLGQLAVSARAMTKPAFLFRQGKHLAYRSTAWAAVIILPRLYEFFFWLAGRRAKGPRPGIDGLNRILVVQPADIGDIIQSVPFLRELRRARPEAWIGLVVQPSMVNPIELCPYVDEVIPWHWKTFKGWGNAFHGHILWWIQATVLAARRLWKHRLDAAISLRWNNDAPQAAALTLMFVSGAPQRVGYVDIPYDRLPFRLIDINRLITRGPVRIYLQHEVEIQLDLLSHLGAEPAETRLEFWTSREDEEFADRVLQDAGLAGHQLLIGFAPGAAWSFKLWPADRFIALGRWLQETHQAAILVFAAKNEGRLAHRVAAGLAAGKTLNLAGRTTIRQMAALLSRCRLFVGNDSGPAHVAAASGVPVAVFFGGGEFARFRPRGFDHEPMRLGFPCSPCPRSCLLNDPRCIRGISLDRAKETIGPKLAPLRPPAGRR